MAAASSRSMLKASSVALNMFINSKPIVNRIPLFALPSIESAASQLANRMDCLDKKIPTQQLPVRIIRPQSVSEEMLMARYSRKVPDIEEDDDEEFDDEFDDESDIDMIDEEDDDEDDDDDEFDDEDEEFVKTKVRTRSHRDL